jgi:hypothetical protein
LGCQFCRWSDDGFSDLALPDKGSVFSFFQICFFFEHTHLPPANLYIGLIYEVFILTQVVFTGFYFWPVFFE